MHATSVLAQAAVILLTGCGLTSAMPGPWSVPQEHFEVLSLRHATPLNPDAVTDVRCLDTNAHIVYHDQNAAQLAICDGLGGAKKTRCRTNSPTTIGKRGSAQFTLTAASAITGDEESSSSSSSPSSSSSSKKVSSSGSISLSKVRWEECVRAARDKCPTGSLSGTCHGGGRGGDVVFLLESTMYSVD